MTADEIARLRALKRDAPPLPYRYREGAEGDPSNGPTFTALEAEHPDLIWSEIARGDYDAWSGYGLMYAAEACTALPKALDALEAVLALHRRVGIYDDCECDDKNTPEHEDIYEIGVTCNKVYEICAACRRDDVYQSEECVNYHQHDTGEHYCPSGTVVAIAEALGIEP